MLFTMVFKLGSSRSSSSNVSTFEANSEAKSDKVNCQALFATAVAACNAAGGAQKEDDSSRWQVCLAGLKLVGCMITVMTDFVIGDEVRFALVVSTLRRLQSCGNKHVRELAVQLFQAIEQ